MEDFLHSEGLLNRLFSQRVITGKRFSHLHSKATSAVSCKDGFGDGYHFVIRGGLDWAKTLVPQGFSPLHRSFPLNHRDELSDKDRAALDVMLCFSDKLVQGYALKKAFYHFMAVPDRNEADCRLDFWLDACDRLLEFKDCRRALRNWQNYILNTFDARLSNGFTEGCNNAIKTLKSTSFGCQNLYRIRKKRRQMTLDKQQPACSI